MQAPSEPRTAVCAVRQVRTLHRVEYWRDDVRTTGGVRPSGLRCTGVRAVAVADLAGPGHGLGGRALTPPPDVLDHRSGLELFPTAVCPAKCFRLREQAGGSDNQRDTGIRRLVSCKSCPPAETAWLIASNICAFFLSCGSPGPPKLITLPAGSAASQETTPRLRRGACLRSTRLTTSCASTLRREKSCKEDPLRSLMKSRSGATVLTDYEEMLPK